MFRVALECLKVVAPVATAFAALNAALPRPTIYVRNRTSQSIYDRSNESDPRIELVFANVGAGVMIPESFKWVCNEKETDFLCDIIDDESIDCSYSRNVYMNKPFEAHARLHLVTFRPVDVSDNDFSNRVMYKLNDSNIYANVTFRYFHHRWGLSSTMSIPLITNKEQL